MIDISRSRDLSVPVFTELQTCAVRIKAPLCAARLWERAFCDVDRRRLGNDLEAAYRKHGTAGMWMRLRGVSVHRAVVDVALALGLLDSPTHQWLLRELGEIRDDPEEAINVAVDSGALVLVERPRAAYWNRRSIDVAWDLRSVLFDFLWELARLGKAGQPLDYTLFATSRDPGIVAKQKSRLVNQPGFPADLAGYIMPAGRRSQRLDLPPAMIRLFEIVTNETARELTA